MTDRPRYPVALVDIEHWQAANNTTTLEARQRFAQLVVLQSVASETIGKQLIFKGGNALRFVYASVRSTVDLDFTATKGFPDDESRIRTLIDRAVARGAYRFGMKMKCQKVKRNPQRSTATMPTYIVTVAYQMPGDRLFDSFERLHTPIPTIIDIEISLNDRVCETTDFQLHTSFDAAVRTCSIDDILAEKLRALLQQVPRNRSRPQDLYDVAWIIRNYTDQLDTEKTRTYLLEKAKIRAITPTLAAFGEEVLARASATYESLKADTGDQFISAEDAWKTLQEFLPELGLPSEA